MVGILVQIHMFHHIKVFLVQIHMFHHNKVFLIVCTSLLIHSLLDSPSPAQVCLCKEKGWKFHRALGLTALIICRATKLASFPLNLLIILPTCMKSDLSRDKCRRHEAARCRDLHLRWP